MKDNEIIVPELNDEFIKSKIFIIRGKRVLLDSELARIYGYTTKALNQQVQRNIEKFPEEFMFKLDDGELQLILKSQFVTSSWGGNRRLPNAFTEQGVYMLMTILKGDLATKQSIALIRAFKKMKDYIVENNDYFAINASIINDRFLKQDIRFDNIEAKLSVVMENFIDPSKYKHFLILDGEKIEADIAYQKIYRLAKKSIYIIDNYIDSKTIKLLKGTDVKDIIIMTENKNKSDLALFLKDAGLNAKIIKNGRCHDRYIIIDYNTNSEKIYLSGASSKDAGNKVTTIIEIENTALYHQLIDDMLKKQK
ncbi:MAG: ORF6N domain-containing protein [Clostridia bacterium]|nr:ORF6N domain-containing protein [Clostridia bacterium]